MRRMLPIILIASFIALISSCGVSPEEAINNLQHPKVKIRTSMNIPVIATTVNTGEMFMENLKNLESEMEGLKILEGSPVKVTYNATIFEIKPDDISGQIPELSGEIPINFGVSLPTIGEINETVNVSVPEFPSKDITIHVPGLPAGESTTDPTETTIDLGITSSKLEAFKVNGNIVISAQFPWDDVSLVSVDATITDGNGNVIKSGTFDAQDNEVSINLDGKEFQVGSGSIKIEYSLTVNSGSLHDGGDINISLNPDLSITFLKGLEINFSNSVNKPEGVEEIDIKSGRLVLESPQLEFVSVSGSVGENPLSVEGGKIVADLGSISLPVEVSVDTVDATVKTLESQIEINGALEDLEVATLVYLSDDLDVASSNSIPLGELAQMIKSLKFSGGKIKLEYDSSLPMDVNVVLRSEDFDPPLERSFVIEGGESSELDLIDLTDKSLLIDDSFDISFEASPENYDGEKLTLNNVTLGRDLRISATITVEGIRVGEIVLNSTTLSYNGEIPIGEEVKEILPYVDVEATLDSNVDMSGTIDATFEGEQASVALKSGEVSLDDLVSAFKRAVENMEGSSLEYSVDIKIESATISVSEPLHAKIEAEIPLKFDLGDESIEIPIDHIEPVDLSELRESGAELLAATLTVKGTNTSGITPVLKIKAGSQESEIDMKSGFFQGKIGVSGEDLSGEKLPISATAVLSGQQVISSEGKVEIIVTLQTDLLVSAKGGDGE